MITAVEARERLRISQEQKRKTRFLTLMIEKEIIARCDLECNFIFITYVHIENLITQHGLKDMSLQQAMIFIRDEVEKHGYVFEDGVLFIDGQPYDSDFQEFTEYELDMLDEDRKQRGFTLTW